MTYATDLTAGQAFNGEMTLLIDGIPVLFGTSAGLVLSSASLFTSGLPASMTSVEAILKDSVAVEGGELNLDMMMVLPGGGSLELVPIPGNTWERYFERRRGRTKLQTLVSASAITITVYSTSAFTSASMVFCDRETMTNDGIGGQDIDVTRNYAGLLGTEAAIHQAGAVVSVSPVSLKNRMGELRMWSNTLNNTLLRRIRIKDVHWTGHSWAIAFDDAMAMLDKQIAVGFQPARVEGFTVQGDESILLSLHDNDFWSYDSGDLGQILLTGNDMAAVLDVTADGATGPQVAPNAIFQAVAGFAGSTFRFGEDAPMATRVYRFTGSPMKAALKMLTSVRGDGDNGTYDVLYGLTAEGGGTGDALTNSRVEKRMGAAIPEALLSSNLTSAKLLRDVPGWCYLLGDHPVNIRDVLEEVGHALQGFWYWDADGKLNFKQISAAFPTTTVAAALDENVITQGTSLQAVDDESEVVNAITIKCNWDPQSEEFLGVVNLQYPRTAEVFRDIGRTITVERKGLLIDLPDSGGDLVVAGNSFLPGGLPGLVSEQNRVFFRRQFGTRKYSVTLPWRYHTLTPGDIVTIEHSALKAFDGSTLTASTCKFEIISTGSLDLKRGTVTFSVAETWTGKPVSPTAEAVTGGGSPWDAGTKTLTLQTSSKFGGGATPGRYFAVGWKIRIFDYSATPVFSTASAVLTITAVGDTSLTFDAAPAFTPDDKDIVVQALYADSDNTTTNSAETVDQRGHFFLGAATGLGATPDAPHEWA